MNNENKLPQLSKRLQTVADMVTLNFRVADIGTDHGFVPIYLYSKGISPHVIAMDVRSGPLERARTHIEEYGLKEYIECRLSDGMEKLEKGEADAITCAGMGGPLMQRIIEEGNPQSLGIKEMVLQPQSDLLEFRKYLDDKGYLLLEETIIFEEGKYYFPMKVRTGLNIPGENDEIVFNDSCLSVYKKCAGEFSKALDISMEDALRMCYRFGPINIKSKSKLLVRILKHDKEVAEGILPKLDKSEHKDRCTEIEKELIDIDNALRLCE
ncbi:MAG: class I SAM-dependent methyltransferase [Butyrivibrio sp.]|nr:class I SAM-dependent methyltransferase [Butyrivibrio sp.]